MKYAKLFCNVLFFSLVTPAVVNAGALAPSRASDVVTLFTSGTACPSAGTLLDFRRQSDGTDVAFTIPAGQVLVVTGMDFASVGFSPSLNQIVTLSLASSATVITRAVALLDSSGSGAANVSTPLIAIKSGQQLCVSTNGVGNPASILVHGFLAKDK
jgi:hypothetical protein